MAPKPPTWRVLEWDNKRDGEVGSVSMTCDCGRDAECPTSGEIEAILIAGIGMRLIFEPGDYKPPDGWLPPVIQCRRCARIYSDRIEG